MSSLLRSTKFVRYFTGAARTLILNSAKTTEANLLLNPKALCSANSLCLRDYATSKKDSLEPLLLKLDSEVRKYGRINKKDIDDVFDEIRTRSDISSSQSLLVIRCCGELVPEELPEKRTLLVQKIWSVLTERGVPMDISHYNALLRVYVENEHPFSPAQFLKELENKGIQPNRVTYQRLMWRSCQEGDVDGAIIFLEKMRELNFPVSEPVLNALVMGHSFLGDTDGAKAVIETMAAAGLQPSNRTYCLLACGNAKQGNIDEIENILKIAKDKDIELMDKDILEIIEHLALGGHEDKVDKLIPHLHKGYGYNQEVCNHVLRLLIKGKEQIAKKILATMVSGREDTPFKGAFFIKQLLRINKPADDVIKTCKELKEEGLIPNSMTIAFESSLQQGKSELALKLLHELKKGGFEIRQHYYWPILAQKGKEGDEEGLLQTVRDMSEQNLIPSGEALRDYIIPYLIKKDSPLNVILKLQIANVPTVHSARNVMLELLESGEINKAAEIALQFTPRGHFEMLTWPLINALNKTKDIPAFVDIIHVVSSQPILNTDEEVANDDVKRDDTATAHEVGRLIRSAVKNLREPNLCETLIDTVHSKGIRISSKAAEEIEQFLGNNMTTKLSDTLSKLTSTDLEPVPINNMRKDIQKTVPQLEQLIEDAKAKDSSGLNKLYKQLLVAYIKQNDVDKVENLYQELKANNFEFSMTVMAQLFEFYVVNNKIEIAHKIKAEINQTNPDFVLNRYKLILMANALIQNNKYDEALQFLKENKPQEELVVNFLINSKCWQMLNYLAEQKEVEKVKEITRTLTEYNYAEPSNILLGPSIKVHLVMDDLEGALKEFEHCCNNYRTTPWKGELMKALIVKEDATKLQWLADLSTQIHGEVNILHDLVLAFVECGRLRQARRILETPGLQARHVRLDTACKRYVEEGKSEYLENLLEATKELSNIDRSNIFYHLLTTYCNANETDKALGLWTLLQEEGEVPSSQFLSYLGNHLKSKNMKIPFVLPDDPTAKPKQTSKTTAPVKQNIPKKNITENIEKLIQEGNAPQAMDYAIKMIQDGNIPKTNVLKYLLKTLAEQGNVEKIEQLSKYVDDNLKREITYDNKYTLAMFVKGAGGDIMDSILQEIKSAETKTEVETALKRFPKSTSLIKVINDEKLLTKCEEIVEIAASKGEYIPANLLWMEYILAGKEQDAENIWSTHLCNAPGIIFRRLLQESHVQKDPKIIESLIAKLDTNKNISGESKGNAYSRLINLYILENNVEKAKATLEDALKSGVTIKDINKSTLKRLQKMSEEAGKEFQHAV